MNIADLFNPSPEEQKKLRARRTQPSSGQASPLGATVTPEGVNFAVFSSGAKRVQLLLFEDKTRPEPTRKYDLHSHRNRTGDIWHIFIPGLSAGVRYAYRVAGKHWSAQKYDFRKVLVDPYAKALDRTWYDRAPACNPKKDNLLDSLRGIVIEPAITDFDWHGTESPRLDPANLIIYELHPKGFTANPNSHTSKSAPIPQLKEKLSYLKNLGINAVELLPIHAFDNDQEDRSYWGRPLTNYWGYSTLSYFALHEPYFSDRDPATQFREFKEFVRAAHSQGIAVIMDVVYNHTTEGNHQGPTLSFRGFDNTAYYITAPDDRYYYMDYTGCGHTFNANHPQVTKLIVDSLEYFVREFRIDGFRFDLAACFYYNSEGYFMAQPPLLQAIENSETLKNTLLIAEPWDASGLNLLGNFGSTRWLEWNGGFRDLTRQLLARSETKLVRSWSQVFWGDTPQFLPEKSNCQSVNFVTCHDGFTLADLVSYSHKHNEANGYNNQDGADENYSTNSGAEGQTNLSEVNECRFRQIRNFLTVLLLSRGSIMLSMGDEVGRTQWGNNNAFNQDNMNSYFDWDQIERNSFLLDFTRSLIKLRLKLKLGEKLSHSQFTGDWYNSPFNHNSNNSENRGEAAEKQAPGCLIMNLKLNDQTESESNLSGSSTRVPQHLCLVLNPTSEPQWANLERLEKTPDQPWKQMIDTNNVAPHDFIHPDLAEPIIDQQLFLMPHSLKVLVDW